MKKLKSTIFVVLCLLVIALETRPISAFVHTSGTIIYNQDGTESLLDENGYYHSYFDAYGNPVLVSDALAILSNSEIFPEDELPNQNSLNYVIVDQHDAVILTSTSTISGTTQQVTSWYAGPCTISYTNSATTNSTWSYSFSASVKEFIINKLTVQFGISYNESSSSGTSQNGSWVVPSGQNGAIYFTPYLTRIQCMYCDSNYHGYPTVITTPQKTSAGYTNGLYELVTQAS